MQTNIGWLFYKDFYNNILQDSDTIVIQKKETIIVKDIDWSFLKSSQTPLRKGDIKPQEKNESFLRKKTERIEKHVFKPVIINGKNIFDLCEKKIVPESQTITLTTIYPGLLIGSGYQHESRAQGEYKLGFFFDHTTGLPVIPGSSVKGLLRSVFNHANDGYDNRGAIVWLLYQNKCPAIKLKIQNTSSRRQIAEQLNQPENLEFVTRLKLELFEGMDEKGNPKNIYSRDSFYDAFIIKSKGHDGRFLASDFITPHKHPNRPELNPFSDPTPIMFLKILPNVEFCFQFRVHDGLITAGDKIKLFKELLLQRGIGAKTNVGYGQFKP